MRAWDRNDLFFFGGFWAALLVVGALGLLLQLSSSATAAAWVQAIGSLLALGAAVLVPYLSATVTRQQAHVDKIRRSHEVIVLLIGEVVLLSNRVKLLKRKISGMPLSGDPQKWLEAMKLEVPDRIEWAVYEANVDGKTLYPVINMLIGTSAYNGYVEMLHFADIAGRHREKYQHDLSRRLDLIEGHCDAVVSMMKKGFAARGINIVEPTQE
jgi:hypothetical protein